jgi:hypothetical protein
MKTVWFVQLKKLLIIENMVIIINKTSGINPVVNRKVKYFSKRLFSLGFFFIMLICFFRIFPKIVLSFEMGVFLKQILNGKTKKFV